MKKKRIFLAVLLAGVFLSACNTTRYLTIEAFKPAEVTFRPGTKKIILVNNAVSQPADWGFHREFFGKESPDTIRTDSAAWDACRRLGMAIQDQRYFEDVLLWNDTVRHDDAYYSATTLTPEQVERICRESGADAVISLDRLLFRQNRKIHGPAGIFIGEIEAYTDGILRSYQPGESRPLATVAISDSLFWEDMTTGLTQLNRLLPTGEEAVRELAGYAGERMYTYFIPHWKPENRRYYQVTGARWKEAEVFLAHNKWEEAASCWEGIFQKEKNPVKKGKAAFNLALANEIRGDFRQALHWLEVSTDCFRKAGAEKNKEPILWAQVYRTVLQERIEENKQLNRQISGE